MPGCEGASAAPWSELIVEELPGRGRPVAGSEPIDSSSDEEISVTTCKSSASGGGPVPMSSDASESSDQGGELPGETGAGTATNAGRGTGAGVDANRRGAPGGATGRGAGAARRPECRNLGGRGAAGFHAVGD